MTTLRQGARPLPLVGPKRRRAVRSFSAADRSLPPADRFPSAIVTDARAGRVSLRVTQRSTSLGRTIHAVTTRCRSCSAAPAPNALSRTRGAAHKRRGPNLERLPNFGWPALRGSLVLCCRTRSILRECMTRLAGPPTDGGIAGGAG